MTIYAIKAPEEPNDVDKIFASLTQGEARFGWSYIETADQRSLDGRVRRHGWNTLSEDEQNCFHDFLLRVGCGDYVVHINVPAWGQCTMARVTGDYDWRYDDEDFNHRFPVDSKSVCTFNRSDTMVPPALRARLSLQGRWWTIYTEPEFTDLLMRLKLGATPGPSSPDSDLMHLQRNFQPHLSRIVRTIQETLPGSALEPFVQRVFERVPNVKEVTRKQGRADLGADLIVIFEVGPIPGLIQTLVVQVKSYSGQHVDTGAVEDVRRAFQQYQEATMGLIVSTAAESSLGLDRELDKLREESGKPVSLLIGDELAAFFLRYGADLLLS